MTVQPLMRPDVGLFVWLLAGKNLASNQQSDFDQLIVSCYFPQIASITILYKAWDNLKLCDFSPSSSFLPALPNVCDIQSVCRVCPNLYHFTLLSQIYNLRSPIQCNFIGLILLELNTSIAHSPHSFEMTLGHLEEAHTEEMVNYYNICNISLGIIAGNSISFIFLHTLTNMLKILFGFMLCYISAIFAGRLRYV